jgi:outer membrane protein with beta-barrel domain
MRSASIFVAAFTLCAGTLVTTRDAHALGPVDLEVGAKVGVGTNPISSTNAGNVSVSSPNPLGFGLGARGGVSFLGIYGGIQFMYYFGSSQDTSVLGQSFSASEHSLLYGIEAGYGFTLLDLLTIRPQIGIGNFTATASVSGNGAALQGSTSQSNSNLYLEPGVTGIVSLGMWFVGADANALFLPGADHATTAFTFHGQVGVKL